MSTLVIRTPDNWRVIPAGVTLPDGTYGTTVPKFDVKAFAQAYGLKRCRVKFRHYSFQTSTFTLAPEFLYLTFDSDQDAVAFKLAHADEIDFGDGE